jgi:tetratricopeptide (TPR) repeat protein
METSLVLNTGFAELHLRDGELNTANMIFLSCYKSFGNIRVERCMFSLERLADLSHGMNNIEDTLGWAVILLRLAAVKSREKMFTMQAFRCLGQIFTAQEDFDTSLSLFEVALDGFSRMDIHRWKADCMVRIADICNKRGEVLKSIKLWKAARSLFERSSQATAVTQIEVKLAAVDPSIFEEYEKLLRSNEPTGEGQDVAGGGE